MAEFRRISIPGGIDVPGAELAYRVHDLAPDPATTVVVNCAGRTRSIIGAQSLINAGIPNRVVALENGTMGWHLAGFELDHGRERTYSSLTDAGAARARTAAQGVARRFHVPDVGKETLAGWRDDNSRTTYLLDVRDPAEFAAGHLPGARSAPGGQLVQATDEYVGVRGARLVLTDNDGVRATMTASWLIQMGWPDVYVLSGGLEGAELATGRHRTRIHGLDECQPESMAPAELAPMMERGEAVVVDVANSLHYNKVHIAGAWFAIRSRMPGNLEKLPLAPVLVLTSKHGILPQLAAVDAAASGRTVRVLDGGTDAWIEAGMPVEEGFTNMADEPEDRWYKPYDLEEGDRDAMKDYLSWEVDLVGQIERDGTAGFRRFP
jgi:rhodanese-related sulfurtransferase